MSNVLRLKPLLALRAIRSYLAVRHALLSEKAFFLSERGKALSRVTVWLARTYSEKANPRCPSAHAAPYLRLRSRRGYAPHTRLSGTQEYSAYRALHRDESGKVREIVEVNEEHTHNSE